VALLVETLTENRNRTSSDVRTAFGKHNGNLGEPGSVAYLFDRKGLLTIAGSPSEDAVLDAAAEAGAEDATLEGDRWQIVCNAKDFARVRDAIASSGLELASAELTMLPQTTVTLDVASARSVLHLMDALEELEDVQSVYSNFDIPDEVLAEVS
jgi:YebC/PmpR family DNA-binding regulatory protein